MTKAKQGKAPIDFVTASTTIDAAPEAVFAVPADPSTHTTPIGFDAQRPNPALEPLAPLVGTWRTTGTHPFFPGVVFHGRTSFAWHEGGAFLLMRSEIDEPQIPSGVAVIGSDDAVGTFTMLYFDERDVSRRYIVDVADGEVSWHRDEAGFAQRMCVTIDVGGGRLYAQGTMAHNGGPWEDDLPISYERIDDRARGSTVLVMPRRQRHRT
jgi:hypothetical protein